MTSGPIDLDERHDVPTTWRQSEHQPLAALVEHLDIGVVFEDASGTVCVVNSALCELFGIDVAPDAMIGRSCRECAQEAKALFVDPDAFLAGFERADQGPMHFAEQRHRRDQLRLRDGRMLERSFRHMGPPDGLLWQYKDVTEDVNLQLALASSEGRVRSIVATTLDAVVAVDERGRIREFNRSAEALFGWSPEEVIGLPLAEVLIPAHLRAGYYAAVDRTVATGTSKFLGQRRRVGVLHKRGEVVDVDAIVFRMEIDGATWFTAFLREAEE